MNYKDYFQLSYCTNIHPGVDWQSTFASLQQYVPVIKERVVPQQPFGLGLRLSNRASEELADGENMAQFQTWLAQNDLYVFTMNGFPYGNFHDERVKDQVHAPDWTHPNRLAYTTRLFEQLSQLLPKGMSGGISTSPISYKYWHRTPKAIEQVFRKASVQLVAVIQQLAALEKRTGKYLHLDIEPEPDGLLENSDEVLGFFKSYLVPIAVPILKRSLGVAPEEAQNLVKRYITVCYDICHFSLAYEEPAHTFQKFAREGIRIGKIQVSAALKILYSKEREKAIWDCLSAFDEPTYLHQVTELVNGKVTTYSDLPMVLEAKKEFTELRAHFHVPIFVEGFNPLFSTQDHILKVLAYLKDNPVTEHLEIETYTWEVLPKPLKKELTDSIVREIEWLKDNL